MFTFDDVITNKWFVIALIIALVVVIFLYSQKKCGVEGMRNVDLTQITYDSSNKNYKKRLGRKNIFNEYDEYDDSDSNPSWRRKRTRIDDYPQPLDTRPDLSQCQPCKPCICSKKKY